MTILPYDPLICNQCESMHCRGRHCQICGAEHCMYAVPPGDSGSLDARKQAWLCDMHFDMWRRWCWLFWGQSWPPPLDSPWYGSLSDNARARYAAIWGQIRARAASIALRF